MKRRLLKKKRLGEFQELEFEVSFIPVATLSRPQWEALFLAFLEHAIEANDLVAGGGGSGPMKFFVTSAKRRGSATDEQRHAVQAWLESRTDVSSCMVGTLQDAWYGDAQ